ncbi:MAG TPA: hypothetical protein DGG95_08350 [Cytophagales bacterium]|jgi:hypothetical protein|nr:hypothetical protein [Cytophagales bacterium]
MIALRNILISVIFFTEDFTRIVAVDLGNRLVDLFSSIERTAPTSPVIPRKLIRRAEEKLQDAVRQMIMRQTMSDRRRKYFGSDPFRP